MTRMLDLQITGKCNLNCKFCCGAPRDVKCAEFEDVKKVIDKLAAVNVERIVITGGEPLIYPHFDELVEYIKSKNIEIYLSTNAYFLDKHLDVVTNNVACVGLPLDGSYPELCKDMTRELDQIQTTIGAVEKIKAKNPNIKIKIGTVVSKKNINDLKNIKQILENCTYKPNVWRLYEFSPLGTGLVNRNEFEITTQEFIEKTNQVMQSSVLDISTLTNEASNDAYIFLHPNMDIILLTNDEYIKVGNACEFSEEDFENLFTSESKTLINQDKNRKWLEK